MSFRSLPFPSVSARSPLCLSLPLLMSLLCGCGPPGQAAASPIDDAELEPVSTTVFGDRVLLFVEYPRLVRGESARFLAHFTVLATGEPVRSGRVVLEIGTTTLAVDNPKRDGLFIPEGSLPEAGRMRATLTVSSPQVDETLDLGEFVVHASGQQARAAAEADVGDEPVASVPFLLEPQWKLKLLLAQAAPRTLTRRLVVPARVALAEGASAVVSSPVSGRLLAPVGGALPRSGDAVEAGQALALVDPPLSAADAAQLRAVALEWDLQSLAVEQALADAEVRLRFAQIEQQRIAQLRPDGLATQQQLDQAERDLSLARSALDAGLARRASLEALRSRREGSDPRTPGAQRYLLPAPIAGIVVGMGRVLGESVEAGEPLFRIVDAAQLWIEGRVPESGLQHLGRGDHDDHDGPGDSGRALEAVVSFPSLPGVRLDVGGADDGRMLLFGPEVDAASRTLLVRYELPSAGTDIRPGMLADLELALETVHAAVSIPYRAVVMDQGLPSAYVMLGGELFQRRDLVLGLRDGDLVEVLSGVDAGERVATRGAATVRMAALSPASFGAGHQH